MYFLYFLYYIFSYLALPIVLIRLLIKGKKNKNYLLNIKERLAIYSSENNNAKKYMWIHAVSVGEIKSIENLIHLIAHNYPNVIILLTCSTPTGRDIGGNLFEQYIKNNKLQQIYLPYDCPYLVKKFFKHFKPKISIIIESELWPHLLKYAKYSNIPIILANARLSPKSYSRMLYFKSSINKMLSSINIILAQSQVDADYFIKIGAKNVEVMGNLKFDNPPNKNNIEAAKKYIKSNKKIVLAASTRDGEEKLILDAWIVDKKYNLIIVPRHLHRIIEIQEYLQQLNISYIMRSELNNSGNKNLFTAYSIILGDSIGEMPFYIELADIVMMGGSWLKFGGQNLLEPCMQNKLVLIGPHTDNFLDISNNAVKMGAAFKFDDVKQAFEKIDEILTQAANSNYNRNKPLDFISSYQGASIKVIQQIKLLNLL